ncbi:hypothetical protein FOMG_18584 [Fusarium oxysporum f. sp. melonis 26406]|nr:hypothetical protein FOMG_18584 [Fusarium oxysporum f. sp. melonis 26406]
MICVGVCLGWAWGVITMKAALATRPQSDVNARYTELQQSAPENTTNVEQASGQSTYAQVAVFEGFMLDTRVTATYFCMLGLFIYLVARLRVSAPKLALVTIFALVIADIHLTTSPLIPTFQGTIPQTMVIPTAVAIGIGLACNILFFPQSTSQIVRNDMKQVTAPITGFIKALRTQFATPKARFDLKQLQRLNTEQLARYNDMETSIKFLPVDFAYGKWSPKTIESLHQPLRQVFIAFRQILQVCISEEEWQIKQEALEQVANVYREGDSKNKHSIAYHQIAKTISFRDNMKHSDTDDMTAKSFGVLSLGIDSLLETWALALDAIRQAFDGPKQKDVGLEVQEHERTLSALQEARDDFEELAGKQLSDTYSHLFDEQRNILPTNTGSAPPLYGLIIGVVFQERLINLATTTAELLERIIEIEKTNPTARFWLPTGLQHLFSWGLSQDATPTTVQKGLELNRTKTARSGKKKNRLFKQEKSAKKESDTGTIDEVSESAAGRLQNVKVASSRQRTRSSKIFLAIIQFFAGPEGLFALRTLIVTIALAIPAVIPSSAGFYYREKGFWALVMAQTTLTPLSADFVSGVLIRTACTIAGGVLGLVAWYIGAGSGPGNPYGMSAIMAPVIVVLMWFRLFTETKHMMAVIVLASTVYLIVANGWVNSHIPSYGNPGYGYEIFWRRILLVLIGFGAATFVNFFPRPPSANRHYRCLLAEQIAALKDRYALFVSVWRSPPDDLLEVAEEEAMVSEEVIESLFDPIKLTNLEFSTSNIDTDTLSKTCLLVRNLNLYLTQLLVDTARLPLPIRSRFMLEAGLVNENLVADLMAVLTLVQQALVSGTALPAVLPAPLMSRATFFENWGSEIQSDASSEASSIDARNRLSKEEGRRWVSAVYAYVRFLGSVDDLLVVVKKAVGEESHVDSTAFDLERR